MKNPLGEAATALRRESVATGDIRGGANAQGLVGATDRQQNSDCFENVLDLVGLERPLDHVV